MTKKYSLTMVLRSISEPELEKISTVIKNLSGQIEKKDDWGKKDLAYQIKGQVEAFYQDWLVSFPPEKLRDLQKKLCLNENLLRFLIVKQE